MQILIARGEKRLGSYSPEEIRSYLQAGNLLLTDWTWSPGSESWKPLSELLAEFSRSQAGSPVPESFAVERRAHEVFPKCEEPHPGSYRDDKGELGYVGALAFPFRQQRWLARIWWLSFLGFIPLIDLIILRGWRLDVVRRFSCGDRQLLPDLRNLMRFAVDGAILWTMTLIYTVVPFLIIMAAGQGVLTSLLEILRWFQAAATGAQTIAFKELLSQEGGRLAGRLAIEAVYFVVAWPIYRAGMIRYAATGRILSFFRILANARFVATNLKEFVKMALYVIPTWIVIAGLSAMFSATGFGALLVPAICLPLYYWSTAFEYGHLAQILVRRMNR